MLYSSLGNQASAYHISGGIDFNYYDYSSKINNTTTTMRYWTQNYRADLGAVLWDPRFLRFNAGVAYTDVSYISPGNDTSTLTYHVNGTFFPGMKISWDLSANKNTMKIDSTSFFKENEVSTTTYGGILRISPGATNGRGNNNTSNNNNNGSDDWNWLLPSLTFSHYHSEAESLLAPTLLHETLDRDSASLDYRAGSRFTLNLNGDIRSYENLLTKGTYENRNANLVSTMHLTKNADLGIIGLVVTQETEGITGFAGKITTQDHQIRLDVGEHDGFRQKYSYSYNRNDSGPTDLIVQKAKGEIQYRLSADLLARGGIDYSISDYVTTLTSTTRTQSSIKNGGAFAGAVYTKQYAPAFLGSFVFEGNYDLAGHSLDVSSDTGGTQGSGWYYDNKLGLRLFAVGWQKENLSLDYAYNSRRDSSPLNADMLQQSYGLLFTTTRISRTNIQGDLRYTSNDIRSSGTAEYLSVLATGTAGVNQKRRNVSYNVRAEHALNDYIMLLEQVSRGQATSTTIYSLFTGLPSDTSFVSDVDTSAQITIRLSYPITRRLQFRTEGVDMYRRQEHLDVITQDFQRYEARAYLNYHYGMIFLNLEYRWQQDNPDVGAKTTQNIFFAKLSRPF